VSTLQTTISNPRGVPEPGHSRGCSIPRIYVASLSDYNNGEMYGEWLDIPADVDDLAEDIECMLKFSPRPGAEEWAIHDYEGFASIRIGEHESLATIVALAGCLSEHDPVAFSAWHSMCEDEANDPVEWSELFCDAYRGEWDSLGDYTYDTYCGMHGTPSDTDMLAPYVDWERMGREWEMGGDIWTHVASGTVYVFSNM